MRIVPLGLLALACALGLLAVPGDAMAGWGAPETLTRSGSAYGVSVAAGVQGDAAVAYIRSLHGQNRAEVRRGSVRGTLAAPVVLDTSSRLMDTSAVAFGSDRRAYVARRRFVEGNHRVWGASVDRNGRVAGRSRITGGGESAYGPRFALPSGAEPLLFWGRRTFAGAALATNAFYERLRSLPGPSVEVSMTVAADGTVIAAWTTGGAGFGSQLARPQGTWSPPQRLSDPAIGQVVSPPQLTVDPDGTVLAAWTTSSARGVAVDLAVRPPGTSAFGASTRVVDPSVRARSVQITGTASGEVLLAYVAAANGLSGPVNLVRLRPSGEVAGRAVLSPPGESTREVSLRADGVSATFAAWTESGPRHGALRAVRIAPGGIIGSVRTLAGTAIGPPALAGLPNAGALLAWASPADGRVRLARYTF